MNSKQMYLAWLRTNYPVVYTGALRKAMGGQRGTGGLATDLLKSLTTQGGGFGDIDTDFAIANPTVDVTDVPISTDLTSTDSGFDWSNLFTGITKGVSSIASTLISTSAQKNLLQVNTQRAAQGLPPLNANGVPVTAAQLAPADASILAMEQRMGASVSPGLLMLGGGLLLAVILFSRRSA